MSLKIGTTLKPTQPGIYAAEVFHGWKLLEWKDGAWWHLECTGRWEAGELVQWLGPLPERVGQKKGYDL